MEQKKKKQEVSSVYCDRFPRLSAKYPWFVVQNMEDDMDVQIFSTLQDPLFKYQCRIPDLLGGRFRGCFHGWLILSNHPHNNIWSLYDPSTSNLISLPPLILKDGDYQSIKECCLSAPPDDPDSVILLTRTNKPTFVFCQLSPKRKKSLKKKPRWTEISYSNQLKKLTMDGELLHSLTCCNGKIYALSTDGIITEFFIQIDVVVKDREVVIKLMLFGPCPYSSSRLYSSSRGWISFLKGSCSELFYLIVGFRDETKKTPGDVYLFKLDLTSINWEELAGLKNWDTTGKILDDMDEDDYEDLEIARLMWEEMQDLKDAIFFVDLGRDNSIFYSHSIASEFGGFIHIRDKMDRVIYSYHVNYQTIVPSPIPSPLLSTSHMSIWECRLQDDHGEAISTVDSRKEEDAIVVRSVANDQDGFNKSCLLNIPFDVLAMIMEFCVGVEYMKFRATCKRCHVAAPLIQWRNKTASRRLQNYFLVSPWLMALQKNRGVITFKDPLFGDDYYMKNSQISVFNDKLYCSRFGWLLFEIRDLCIVFFNPFTNDLRELPNVGYRLHSLSFSAPPTSPDCMVVGFTRVVEWEVFIHFVAQEPISWRMFRLGADPLSLCFPTFFGRDLYALSNKRELIVFKNLGEEDISWNIFEAKVPTRSCRSPAQYFLVKCEQHLLLVIVGGIGEPIEIFKPNGSTQEWEKVNGVGKHMIYICDTTCLCIEAKTPEMENKIYLPQLCSTNGKVVFYSLETCTFHTFNGKNIQENVTDISNATHLSAHAWVEPSWS